MRSNVTGTIVPVAIATLISTFLVVWAFGNIGLIREQSKEEIYNGLQTVESQINTMIRTEFDNLAMISTNVSNRQKDYSSANQKEMRGVGGSPIQVWLPNIAGTALTSPNQTPVELQEVPNLSTQKDPYFQAFLASNWRKVRRKWFYNAGPYSILGEGNLSVCDGGTSMGFLVPVIGTKGAAIGLVYATIPMTIFKGFLPQNTYLVDPELSSVISRYGVNQSDPGSVSVLSGTNTNGDLYSTARRIPISSSSPPWRLRTVHETGELWSKPEVKRILDFNAVLLFALWGSTFLLIRSSNTGRNRQRKLIGNLAQKIIWITDEQGNIDFVLGKITSRLGWKEMDYLEVNIGLFAHPDDRSLIAEAISNAQAPVPKDEIIEIRFENRDHEYRWYEVTITNMVSVPEINGIVVTAHDIEHRIHATAHIMASKRAAEKANEAKSEFLSRMSHELRTPLNAILGFGQLLEMDTTSVQQADNVEQILIAGRHLLDLVNDILDLARIETQKVNLSIERVNISEVLNESFALLAPLSAKSKVALEYCESNCPDIRSDRQKLKQIFINLLTNGVKYNKPGGVVKVSIEQFSDGLKVLFTDSGIGIESHYLDRVFTPFDRLGSENSAVEGTGLGLALSKTLVEAMGATLEVSSVYGEGSVFTVTFNAAAIVRGEVANALEAENTGLADIQGFRDKSNLRVLIVEDNIINLRYVSKLVEKMNKVALMSAMEGGIGIELARSFHPDLILLDLDLPDINGRDVLRALKSDITTREIRTIVMSAESNPEIMAEIMDLGAYQYVTKPVDVESLFMVFTDNRKAA